AAITTSVIESSNATPVGSIIGGAIGGVAIMTLGAVAIVYLLVRRRGQDATGGGGNSSAWMYGADSVVTGLPSTRVGAVAVADSSDGLFAVRSGARAEKVWYGGPRAELGDTPVEMAAESSDWGEGGKAGEIRDCRRHGSLGA